MAATDAALGRPGPLRVAYAGSSGEFLAALLADPSFSLAGHAVAAELLFPTLARGGVDWLVIDGESKPPAPPAGAPAAAAAGAAVSVATAIAAARTLSPATRVAVLADQATPAEAAAEVSGAWRDVLRSIAAGGGAAPSPEPASGRWRADLGRRLRLLHAQGCAPDAAWGEAGPVAEPAAEPAQRPIAAGSPVLICVFGPKGGTGKTFIAVNLAALLADRAPGRVALIELDAAGDASIHLDLQRGPSMSDIIPPAADLGEEQVRRSMVRHVTSALDVLRAPPRPELFDLIRPEHVDRLLDVLLGLYRVVVVDTPARPGDEVAALCAARAERLVVVVDADAAGLHRTRAALGALPPRTDVTVDRVSLVVNRWSPHSPVVLRQVEEFMGLPVSAVIRDDRRMAEEQSFCGRPLVITHRQHPLSGDLGALADAVLSGRAACIPRHDRRPPLGLAERWLRRFVAWARG